MWRSARIGWSASMLTLRLTWRGGRATSDMTSGSCSWAWLTRISSIMRRWEAAHVTVVSRGQSLSWGWWVFQKLQSMIPLVPSLTCVWAIPSALAEQGWVSKQRGSSHARLLHTAGVCGCFPEPVRPAHGYPQFMEALGFHIKFSLFSLYHGPPLVIYWGW